MSSLIHFPLALGFGTAGMLWFLLGAGIPILIHLWTRRRHREIRWAAMEYLLAAIRKNTRRINLEQLILLLVRVAIVVALALAVAEPIFQLRYGVGFLAACGVGGLAVLAGVLWLGLFSRLHLATRLGGIAALAAAAALALWFVDWERFETGPAYVATRRTHHVIVLDGSYSMAYQPAGLSTFEKAQALAAEIVEQAPPGDAFTLVLMADEPRVEIATPIYDRRDFLGEIDRLRLASGEANAESASAGGEPPTIVPQGGADVPATFDRLAELVSAVRRDHPKLMEHEVDVISDLGAESWAGGVAENARIQEAAKKLAETANLVIYDLGSPGASNVAITDLRLVQGFGDEGAEIKFATIRRDATFQFDVRDFGGADAKRLAAQIWVDGNNVVETQINVPAGGQARGELALPGGFVTPGDHRVELRLPDDGLNLDNRRFISVPVREQLKVLCVNGRDSVDPFERATVYLTVALEDLDNPQRPLTQVVEAPPQAILGRDLSEFDAIFLANVASFRPAEAQELHNFLARGGGLVFFLGDQVRPDNYNDQLAGQAEDAPRVLPAALQAAPKQLDALAGSTFADNLEHEVVRVFAGDPRVKFLQSPVFKYLPLTPLVDDDPDAPGGPRPVVALQFANGDPAIVEERIGQGRVFLLATAADALPINEPWTLLPKNQNFLALVRELLMAAVVGKFEQRNVTVGRGFEGFTNVVSSEGQVAIATPWGAEMVAPLQFRQEFAHWAFAQTDQAGIYAASIPGAEEALYAVNLATRESDLTKIDENRLRDEVLQGVRFRYLTAVRAAGQEAELSNVVQTATAPWYWYLLVGTCGLLFIESTLAWLFGRKRS